MIRKYLSLTVAATLLASGAAQAAAPPFPQRNVTITARNQQVDGVIRDLFGQSNMRVKVSSAITGKINGTFTGTPHQIWSQLSRAFNLVAYYDGAVVRVYAGAEIQTRSFQTTIAQSVVRDAYKMGITDSANVVSAGSNVVTATGVPGFLDRVASLASAAPLNASAQTTAYVGAATPASSPIVSPLLNGAALQSGPARIQTVASRVVSAATNRSPYEVRIFYLRYARADDTIQKSFDRTIVIPGVASIVRGMMGDGRQSSTVSTSGNFDIARQSQPRLLGRGLTAVAPDASQRDYDDGTGGGVAVVETSSSPRDVNGPRVEVDPTNNALVVRDRPEAMSVYEDIVRALDVEPRGVEIEATIIELDIDRLKELGLDFNFQDGNFAALFGGQSSNPTGNFSGSNLAASYVTGALNGFALRITALEKNGSLRIVSRPRLSTLNNIPAVFNNQVQYYVRVAGDRQVDLFPVTAGMVMRVNPSVLHDGGELRTRLTIEILDGSPSGLIVDGIPAVKQASINTSAVVKQGESLLIGGMTVDADFDYKSKVPVLGDVPILGQAFRKRSKGSRHIERLFLITPRVLSQSSTSVAAAAAASRVIPLEVLQATAASGRGRRSQRRSN